MHKHRNETGGVIESVVDGGSLAQAGIQADDIIHAVNGKPYAYDQLTLDTAIQEGVNGKSETVVHVDIFRNHKPMSFDIHYSALQNVDELRKQGKALAETPAPQYAPATAAPPSGQRFGFQVRPVTDADVATYGLAKARGIVVVDVEKGSLAEKMGLQPGDVILEVNNSEIGDAELFAQYVKSGAVKKFRIWRKGQALELTAPESL